jgi:hypothetical protein
VIGLVVTVIGGLVCRFNASVEASEPHDFAVRVDALRLAQLRVHRNPRSTFVTIAKRPSSKSAGWPELVEVICPTAQAKILGAGAAPMRRIGTTGKSGEARRWRVKTLGQRNCHGRA